MRNKEAIAPVVGSREQVERQLQILEEQRQELTQTSKEEGPEDTP